MPTLADLWLIAHRGASRDAPENTMAAFRLAIQQGADGIELDLHASADGVPLVIHDATLDRTTNRSGAVATLAAEELHAAGVPTFSEVLDWLPADRALVAEFKDLASVDGAIAALAVRPIASDTVRLISFEPVAIDRVHALAPGLHTGLLLDRDDSLEAGIGQAVSGGHRSIVPNEVDLGAEPERAIAQARAAGLEVGCYVVNDRARADQLRAAGVSFLMSDVPALIRP